MRTGTPNKRVAAWWLVAAMLGALPASAGRPGTMRFPQSGSEVLSDRPSLAWAPGELGVCACDVDAPVQAPPPEAGLSTELFRGNFITLPNFAVESPSETFVSPVVSIGARSGDDKYALRMRGRINVPATGNWRFVIKADDGARLLINNTAVITIDGQRGAPATIEATVANLTAGFHNIEVQYFRNGLEGNLELRWAGPTIADPSPSVVGDEQLVPASALDFVPTLSPACLAAVGGAACRINTDCAADSFCAVSSSTDLGVCQRSASLQLCVDDSSCGRQSACVTTDSVGGTSTFEASVQCPFNDPGCQIPGNAPTQSPGIVAEVSTNVLLERLPEFDTLIASENFVATQFSIAAHQGTDLYAYRFRGFIEIPANGSWTFTTDSDDGSKLFIDGILVVDNDGLHGRIERQGVRTLTAGRHAIEVQFFERFGGDFLNVTWAGPGIPKQTIPASVLSHLPAAKVGCEVASSVLSCEPTYLSALAPSTPFMAERVQRVSLRGVSRSATIERSTFTVAPRLQYIVQVAQDSLFASGRLLFESKPQVPTALPFVTPVVESINIQREPVDVQVTSSCGRVTIGGDSMEVLCNGSGSVTLPFNAPTTGTYTYRARLTGDQAGSDPVRVEVLLDGSVFDGVGPPERRGVVDVTASRGSSTETLTFSTRLAAGQHSVTIRFINDFCCTPGDRNLLVDFVAVAGPSESEVLLDALSIGDVFWRVVAQDGTQKRTSSSEIHLLSMPDSTPPAAPTLIYPSETSAILSQAPGAAWQPVEDAVEYEVRYTSALEQRTVTARTSSTSLDASPAVFARGDALTIEVVAFDAGGNASPSSSPTRVTISQRLRYELEVFNSADLSPGSRILNQNLATATTFGPLDQPRSPSFTSAVLPTSGASTGSSCGVTGDGFVILCGQNNQRNYTFQIPETADYTVAIEAFESFARATVPGAEDHAIMEVIVDGASVRQFEVANLATFTLTTTLTAGVHAISLRYINDLCCTTGDRNLFVRKVTVAGPANTPTFADLLSVGPVFWRVSALDGVGQSRVSSEVHLVAFPDETPPEPPTMQYPEDAAELLSVAPSFVWSGAADVARYRFTLSDGVANLIDIETTETKLDLTAGLERGRTYTITLVAIDAAGNASPPLVRRFDVVNRVSYDFVAATSNTFSPESVVLRRENLVEPRLGVDGLASGTINVFEQVEALEGTGCGTRFSRRTGITYQVLCNENQRRTFRVQAPTTGQYRVTVRASADQAGPQTARLLVSGRSEVESDVSVVFRSNVANQTVPDDGQPEFEDIVVPITLTAGQQSISLSFVNEFCCSPGDRNLLLDTIRVEGPIADNALADVLSRGDVFWTVVARDGARRSNQATNDFIVAFPDRTPPASPLVTYPEVNAALLSDQPAVAWQGVADAVRYRVTVTDLGSTFATTIQTAETTIQWPEQLARTGAYAISVEAVDIAGNISEPSSPIQFSVAPRVRYQLQASTSPGFEVGNMVLDRDTGGATSLGPLDTLFLNPPVSQRLAAFDTGVSGNNCGAVVAGGTSFVNLCNQDNARAYSFGRIPQAGEFLVSVDAFGAIVNGEGPRMAISIDGVFVDEVEVRAGRDAPQRFTFRRNLTPGPHVVTARYTNELCCSPDDRNLFVGAVSIEGPIGNNTLLGLLERGDIYWRVNAVDGIGLTRGSDDVRVVGFPDRVPPAAPQPIYPEVAAEVLSLSPAFVWGPIVDAETYRVRILDASGAVVVDQPGLTDTTFVPAGLSLPRGARFNWTVTAFDRGGNESTSVLTGFTVSHRTRYVFEAASSPAFSETTVIARRDNLIEPSINLQQDIAVATNTILELENGVGLSCGTARDGGRTFVNICNNGVRQQQLRIPSPGIYTIRARLSGTQTQPIGQLGAVEAVIEVDGAQVSTHQITSQFPLSEVVTVDVELRSGLHSFAVRFINDFCCTPADRNLFADAIEVEGPVGNATFNDLLSRGDVYWRVTALDGVNATTVATRDHVVAFPDLFPPGTPQVTYPAQGDQVLSTRPGFAWSAVADATKYRVVVDDLDSNRQLDLGETTETTLDWPLSELPREGRYRVTVVALDAAGNVSVDNTPVNFTIAPRLRYELQASSSPGFEAGNILLERSNLRETSLTTSEPINPLVNDTREAEGSLMNVRNFCGVSGGYVNLCGTGSAVGGSYTILGARDTYELTFRAFAPLVGAQLAQVAILVDGVVVDTRNIHGSNVEPQLIKVSLDLRPGERQVAIRFENDFCCTVGDRNVFVDFIQLKGPVGLSGQTIDQALRIGPVFWRVKALDGTRAERAADNIHIVDFPDETPPRAPLPEYPEDSARILSLAPGFTWSPVADAARYRLVVIDQATELELLSTDVPAPQTAVDGPSLGISLERGRVYRWFVEAVDAAGNRSTTSAQRLFEVGERLTYTVELATQARFEPGDVLLVKQLRDVTNIQFRTIDLPEAGTTFYRVTARDGANQETVSSPLHMLDLPDTKPPAIVKVLYPESGVEVLDATPGFAWAEQEPGLEYDFEISTTNTFIPGTILHAEKVRGPLVELPEASPLEPNNVYFWRVRATDAVGNIGDHGIVRTLALRQRTVPVYTVELATQSFHLDPQPTFEGQTTTTSLTLPANRPLSQGTAYFWRVRADLTIASEPPVTKTIRSREVLSMATGQFVPQPGGVIGTYFSDRTFTSAAAQRLDTQIDFPERADRDPFGDFGGLTGTNGDNFAVRWTGLVFAPRAGNYTFVGVADDTQLLVVNDRTLFNVTQFRGPSRQEGSIQLTEGWHTFVYEMSEGSSSAFAQLAYRCATCSPALAEQVIPPEFLAVPKDNTDTREPEIVRTFVASAMPATTTTPARATLQVQTDEPTVVDVTVTRSNGAPITINGVSTRLLHEIPLGDVRGAFSYTVTATDLNGNTTSRNSTPACTPALTDLIPQNVRATFFSQTNLTGRVLDELQSTIDYSVPSLPAQRLVGTTEYSVRFNGGYFVPPAEVGQHVLTTLADDGQRVSVNGSVVLNDFLRRSTAVQRQTAVSLAAGWNEISLDLLQGLGEARARLAITNPAGFTQTPVSTSRLAAVDLAYLRPRFSAGAENVVVEAQTPQGTSASLVTPSITDCRDPAPRISSNAPVVFPLGTTNVAWTARNRFNEVSTLIQTVVVRDTTPPSIRPLPDMVIQCVSPQQDGITQSSVLTLPTVRVTDNADVSPSVRFVMPATFLLDEPAEVAAIARDSSGNQSRVTFNVTTTDSAALQLSVEPQITVGRADDCVRADGSTGTRVVLPVPRVTNLCLATQESDVTYTHNIGGPAQADPAICLPTGTSVATWTGRLGLRLGQAPVRVNVVNTSFDVDVVDAPSGYRNSNAEVRMRLSCRDGSTDCFAVFDAAGVKRIQWRVEGAGQPTTTEVGDDGTFVARFTGDVVACPLNVVVVDAIGRQGSSRGVCFAIDRAPPIVETGALPTTFLAKDDFTTEVQADINDQDTWPHVFIGEDLDLTVAATDAIGAVDSGIREVSVTLRSFDEPTLPPLTIFAASPAPGTDALRSGPVAVQQVCVSPVCVAGKLDVSRLGVGAWILSVRANDVAGNAVNEERPFKVLNLAEGLKTVFTPGDGTSLDEGWISATQFNRLTTNSTLRSRAQQARGSITRAASFIAESPSTTSLELLKTVTLLSPAGSPVNTSPVRTYLSRALRSEVRRIVEVHSTGPTAGQTWDLFGNGRYTSFDNPVGNYQGHRHLVSAPQVLSRARAVLAAADSEEALGRPNDGIRLSGSALDELTILMDDGVLASFYGRAPHLIAPPSEAFPAGRAERYFLNAFATGSESDYGRELAQVVQQSISRVAASGVQPQSLVASAPRELGPCVVDAECGPSGTCLGGFCVENCLVREDCQNVGDVCVNGLCQLPGPFARVADRIEIFREGVDALDCRIDPACTGRKLQSNLEFFTEIYMNVQDSFDDLADVQNATFSTHAWRQGIALTLQYLLNFTVYTGQAPLVVLAPTDPVTIMTECWWHRMNEAMAGGAAAGVDDALQLFEEGRCLNVEIYNRFYGGEQVLPGDECVDPADFGCPSDGVRHGNAGRCLRVAPELMPTITSMCGPLQ